MRAAIFGVALTSLALVLAATATGSPAEPAQSGSCAKANLNLVEGRAAQPRHRQPGVPAVVGRRREEAVGGLEPGERQGLRVRGRVRGREAARLLEEAGRLERRAVHATRSGPARSRSTSTWRRSRSTSRARAERLVLELVLLRQPGGRRQRRDADRARPNRRRPQAVQARRAGRHHELRLHRRTSSARSQSPAVYDSNNDAISALNAGQIDGIVVDLPTAFYVVAVQLDDGDDRRQAPAARRTRAVRHGVREGEHAHALREPGAEQRCGRTARSRGSSGSTSRRRARPTCGSALTGSSGSRILGSASPGGGRAIAVALAQHARLRRADRRSPSSTRPAGRTSSRRSSTRTSSASRSPRSRGPSSST